MPTKVPQELIDPALLARITAVEDTAGSLEVLDESNASLGAAVTIKVIGTASVAGGVLTLDLTQATLPTTSAPNNETVPTITGTVAVGNTLTATPGTWTGSPAPSFVYTWKRGATTVQTGASPSYTVVAADAGTTLTVVVTGTNASGFDTGTSAGSNVPASTNAAPVNTSIPVISGTPIVGNTLTTTSGTWTGVPAPTFAYQWMRNGAPISGATSTTYVLAAIDLGAVVTCVVTGSGTSPSSTGTSAGVTVQAATTADGVPPTPGTPTLTPNVDGSLTISVTNPGTPWTQLNWFRYAGSGDADDAYATTGAAGSFAPGALSVTIAAPVSGWYSVGAVNANTNNTWFGTKSARVQYTASGTGGGTGGGSTILDSDPGLIYRVDPTLSLPAIGSLTAPDQSPLILMGGTTGTDPAGAGPNDPPLSSVPNVVYDTGSGFPNNTFIHVASQQPGYGGVGKELIFGVKNNSVITRTNTPGDAGSRCHRNMIDSNEQIVCDYDRFYVLLWTMRFPANLVSLPNNWMQLGLFHNHTAAGPDGRQPFQIQCEPGGYNFSTCWGTDWAQTEDWEHNTAAFRDLSVTPNTEHQFKMRVKFSTGGGGSMNIKRRIGRTGSATQIYNRTGQTVRSGDSEASVYLRLGQYAWAAYQFNPDRFEYGSRGLYCFDEATTVASLSDDNCFAYLNSK